MNDPKMPDVESRYLTAGPKHLCELKGESALMSVVEASAHLRQVGTSKLRLKGEDAACSRLLSFGPRLLAVADGHGGSAAALHCCTSHTRANVLDNIEVQLQKQRKAPGVLTGGGEIECACSLAFKLAHTAVRELPDDDSGTTLTVAVLDDDRKCLTVANVGDSFALLGTRPCTPIAGAPHQTTPRRPTPARSAR